MLAFNFLLLFGVASLLTEKVNGAAVAYIYRKENGGPERLTEVGPQQLPLASSAEPWKVKAFEEYKLLSTAEPATNVDNKAPAIGLSKIIQEHPEQSVAATKPYKVNTYEVHEPKPLYTQIQPAASKRSNKVQDHIYIEDLARIINEGVEKQRALITASLPLRKWKPVTIVFNSDEQKPIKSDIIVKPEDEPEPEEDDDDDDTVQTSKKYIEVKNLVIREYDDSKNGGSVKNFGDDKQQDKEHEDGETLDDDNGHVNNAAQKAKVHEGHTTQSGQKKKQKNEEHKDDSKKNHGGNIENLELKKLHEQSSGYHIAYGKTSSYDEKTGDDFKVDSDKDKKDKEKIKNKDEEEQDKKEDDEDDDEQNEIDFSEFHQEQVKSLPHYDFDHDHYVKPYTGDFDFHGIDNHFAHQGNEEDYLSKDHYKKGDSGYGKENVRQFFDEEDQEEKGSNNLNNYKGKEEAGNKKDGGKSKSKGKTGTKNFAYTKQWKTGYNKDWNKEEFKKDRDFYDDADKAGWNRKGDKQYENTNYKKGNNDAGHDSGSHSEADSYSKSHSYDKVPEDSESEHKYANKKGDEKHYKNNSVYKTQKGKSHKKEYGFSNEEEKEEEK